MHTWLSINSFLWGWCINGVVTSYREGGCVSVVWGLICTSASGGVCSYLARSTCWASWCGWVLGGPAPGGGTSGGGGAQLVWSLGSPSTPGVVAKQAGTLGSPSTPELVWGVKYWPIILCQLTLRQPGV